MSGASGSASLVLGAVFDFVSHCFSREHPMVVGAGYQRDRIIDEFEAWAKKRGITLTKIDLETFRRACELGMFR